MSYKTYYDYNPKITPCGLDDISYFFHPADKFLIERRNVTVSKFDFEEFNSDYTIFSDLYDAFYSNESKVYKKPEIKK